MRITLDEVQSRIGSIVDQDEVTTNISSTDYSLRQKYINMALHEWQETTNWQTLYGEFNSLISTDSNNASVALPTNFRKLAGPIKITWDGVTTDTFKDTKPQEGGNYNETVKRVEILGNYQDNYVMRVYGVTLASGASLKVPYYTSAQSLASPADIAEIPNPQFLVKRAVAYLWEAREDSRFPEAKAESERILRNMIEYENIFGYGADYDRVKTVDETGYGFRIGRD